MALAIERDPDPLRADEHGVARVCDSQVLLDVVIQQFNNGAEPEAIAQGFPTLALADVYGVVGFSRGDRFLLGHVPFATRGFLLRLLAGAALSHR